MCTSLIIKLGILSWRKTHLIPATSNPSMMPLAVIFPLINGFRERALTVDDPESAAQDADAVTAIQNVRNSSGTGVLIDFPLDNYSRVQTSNTFYLPRASERILFHQPRQVSLRSSPFVLCRQQMFHSDEP